MADTGAFDAQFSKLADHELVRQAQQGQLQAMQPLFERYCDQIYRYLVYMVGQETIGEELTQEVFLKAWDAVLELRPTDAFDDWLYRIATNLVNLYQKQYQQKSENSNSQKPAPIQMAREEVAPEESMQDSDVQDALRQVTFVYRACLVLHEIEGLSVAQIARRFRITSRNVQFALGRGMRELIRFLPQESNHLDTLRAHLRNLPAPEGSVRSPFAIAPEQEYEQRRYVPSLRVMTSYTRPPQISPLARFLSSEWRAGGHSARHYRQRASAWIALGMICCALISFMTSSSAGGTALTLLYSTTPQLSCALNKPDMVMPDRDPILCVQQSRLVRGYTFTLEEVYVEANQLLLTWHLDAPEGQDAQFLIASALIRVLEPSHVQYLCNTVEEAMGSSSSRIVVTPLSFRAPIFNTSTPHAEPFSFVVQINPVFVFSDHTFIPLLQQRGAPFQFNLLLLPSEIPTHSVPLFFTDPSYCA